MEEEAHRRVMMKEEEARRLKRKQEAKEQEEKFKGVANVALHLRAVPVQDMTTDRITLPPSVLQLLLDQEKEEEGSIYTFEVSLGANSTRAGVLEFSAQEGTVGIPVKTASSLLHGGSRLDMVKVTRVNTPAASRVVARVQPRREGFLVEGADHINLDLKALLEATLRNHLVLRWVDSWDSYCLSSCIHVYS